MSPPGLTVDLLVDFLFALALWALVAAFVGGAVAAELCMWRRALVREGIRKQRLMRARRRAKAVTRA